MTFSILRKSILLSVVVLLLKMNINFIINCQQDYDALFLMRQVELFSNDEWNARKLLLGFSCRCMWGERVKYNRLAWSFLLTIVSHYLYVYKDLSVCTDINCVKI